MNTGGSRIRTENLQSQDIPFSREWSIKGILSLWLQRSKDFLIYFPPQQRLLRLAALNLYLQMYFTRTEGETPATGWAAEGRNLNKSRTLDCTLGMVSCVKWDHTGCIEWVQIHIRRYLYILRQCLIDKHFTLRASFCYMKFTVFIMTEGDYIRLGVRFH